MELSKFSFPKMINAQLAAQAQMWIILDAKPVSLMMMETEFQIKWINVINHLLIH